MGDEELNFTEEEARCWADDPRNQAQEGSALGSRLAAVLLLTIASLILIWLAYAATVSDRVSPPVSNALWLAPFTLTSNGKRRRRDAGHGRD
ncbi:MAG: hypothetical protein ACE15B_08055 [Bryobacteraceae bacterium]